MPIRPENKDRYPADWDAISRAAKDAAGWRCACRGECGRGHEGRCPNCHGEPAYGTGSRVVLTTAHLNHQPEDCTASNLVPMCNGCHLHYDAGHHRVTAALTLAGLRAAAGQLSLAPFTDLTPVEPPPRPAPRPPPEQRPATTPLFDLPPATAQENP